MKIKRIIFAVTLACLFMCGCVSPHQMGCTDAKRDIARGVLISAAFGKPIWIYKDWEDLLRQKYRIEVKWIDVDHANRRVLDYWTGYNEMAVAEFEQRYGTSFIEQTITNAVAIYMSKHPAEAEQWEILSMPNKSPKPN
jgi:hypothetical protein